MDNYITVIITVVNIKLSHLADVDGIPQQPIYYFLTRFLLAMPGIVIWFSCAI